jgi:peptidyl-tRNA hydrolase
MHVGVIHRISDPEAFEQAEQKALEAGLPEGLGLPVHAATTDHSTAICIWEGPSVDAVRDVVESTVGAYSKNEYYEVELEGSAV